MEMKLLRPKWIDKYSKYIWASQKQGRVIRHFYPVKTLLKVNYT